MAKIKSKMPVKECCKMCAREHMKKMRKSARARQEEVRARGHRYSLFLTEEFLRNFYNYSKVSRKFSR